MKEYIRKYPFFSLCGLNCCLCPRFQTEGASRCPGCGGPEFHLKHPTCAVVTCNRKHNNVEFCYECSMFPCAKYNGQSNIDSFISYYNVLTDFEKAERDGLEQYKTELEEKKNILEFLLQDYNDGRRKNYYCLAVNLLPIVDLRNIMEEINSEISREDASQNEKIEQIVLLLEEKAIDNNIKLKLRI